MHDAHSRALLGQGRIRHVSIRLRPDFDKTTLHFRARYSMDRPVRRDLHLDVRDIRLDRATSRGKRLSYDMDQDDPLLGQRLVLRGLEGSTDFTLEGMTSAAESALQWLTPQMTTGGVHPFLYTQCQALHARSLFPCQDTPAVRFTFDAELEVPEPLTAVMGAASRGYKASGSLRRFRFQMRQPIPSYLFALAVGDLDFRATSDRCGVYADPALVDAAAWEFGRAEQMVQTAERMYGPYLWDRYDILVLPKGFPWAGMENPRLTFLSPSLLSGDRAFDFIVMHELGHAWTGNLVTNATWEEFWLNEGWTTYIQHRLDEAIDGLDLVSLTRRSAVDQLSSEFRQLKKHPERTALKFAMEGVDPDEALSNVPYIKGAMFLRAIEQTVGGRDGIGSRAPISSASPSGLSPRTRSCACSKPSSRGSRDVWICMRGSISRVSPRSLPGCAHAYTRRCARFGARTRRGSCPHAKRSRRGTCARSICSWIRFPSPRRLRSA